MQTILVAPTLTAQVRDIIYTLGQQTAATTEGGTTVTRRVPARAIGTLYTNTGAQAVVIFASVIAATANTTSNLIVGGAVSAQGRHLTAGEAQMLAGVANPGELYYVSSTASNTTVLSWVEYGLHT